MLSSRGTNKAQFPPSARNLSKVLTRTKIVAAFVVVLSPALVGLYAIYHLIAWLLLDRLVLPHSNAIYVLLFAAGLIARYVFRRLDFSTATQKLTSDTRPPVVFLRSFTDDSQLDAWTYDDEQILNTREEQIVAALEPLGPVVGIGRPTDIIPRLGMARDYVKDEQWHHRVVELMRTAVYVVILINTTSGLNWELKRAVEIAGPTKLILLVPRSWRRFRTFSKRHSQTFPRGLPSYQIPAFTHTGNVAGIVYFSFDWRPNYLKIPARHLWCGPNAVTFRISSALSKIFITRGIPYKNPIREQPLLTTVLVALLFLVVLVPTGLFVLYWLVRPYV